MSSVVFIIALFRLRAGTQSEGEPMTRSEELASWAAEVTGRKDLNLEPLAGDASFRKYYRSDEGIFADSPPETQKNREFCDIGARLSAAGFTVPEMLHADLDRGFLHERDLGGTSLEDAVKGGDEKTVHDLYEAALGVCGHLAGVTSGGLPLFDRPFIERELAIFTDWFFREVPAAGDDGRPERFFTGRTPAASEFAPYFSTIADAVLAQPYVFMHRDFHCRNIMLTPEDTFGIIDFQDAVKGPLTYDLASLIEDCYFRLSPDFRGKLFDEWYDSADSRGLCGGLSREGVKRAFDFTGLQRHLKAAGIFVRLAVRDGKRGHLRDIPLTISYVKETLLRYPELSGLYDLLSECGVF